LSSLLSKYPNAPKSNSDIPRAKSLKEIRPEPVGRKVVLVHERRLVKAPILPNLKQSKITIKRTRNITKRDETGLELSQDTGNVKKVTIIPGD
jgi:hypothetical protein